MSLASPIFKVMFISGFKESLTSRGTASESLSISLPDDDPAVFVYLSKVVHFQDPKLPNNVDIVFVENLAVWYDKYQCTAPIASCVQAPLEKLAVSASVDDLHKVLLVACLLDAPHLFSSTSWKILVAQEEPFLAAPETMNHPRIPVYLLSE
ncbi:hypothetical protein G647_06228 [Cladophialophora carrionii CBS 160.54]|uniref:BTB domain-containing protein n=1 Tax=Cladophialophora carrionii CBS 160.54 TaxID=1279043 RepID=V9D5K6_9EURO|nr:uncharacterized protein G647_06228 [Cladophialophora carrionii CBS 160.54]ETI22155.1 hypothetical protein G647_06228 [Cladophialophora carrionii CBS 160.54]